MIDSTAWPRVGLFISSTFDDMHGERDYLVKRVLPKLYQWCEERRLHLVDVDLRWGINREVEVVGSCLQAIDACQPLFVCFLGQRFGRVTAIEVEHALQQGSRVIFYLRDPDYLADLPAELRFVYANGHENEMQHLRDLAREEARTYSAHWNPDTGRLTEFDFGDRLLADLQSAIASAYPDRVAGVGTGWSDQQEQFLARTREASIERVATYEALDAYVEGDNSGLFALTGPGGIGKTTALAKWLEHRSDTVLARFVGASDVSTTVPTLLASIVGAATGREPEDTARLRDTWQGLVRGVVVFDALDRLDGGLSDLDWLPWTLPPGLKVVVSYATDAPGGRDLRDRMAAGNSVVLHELAPFGSLTQRREIVDHYFSGYFKELAPELMEWLIRRPSAGNPLYLKVVLAELRVFGDYRLLKEHLTSRFGANPQSAFDEPLRRMESDSPYAAVSQQDMVRHVFGLLAHARTGLSVEELASIVPGERSEVEDAIQVCLRQVRPFLARRKDRYDFLHDSFRAAARSRYAHTDWHGLLAGYFDGLPLSSRRKLSELPYHLMESGRFDRLRDVLCNLAFIEAACASGLTSELVADFDAARQRTSLEPLADFERFIRSESHHLSRYASISGFTRQQAANWAPTGSVHDTAEILPGPLLRQLNPPSSMDDRLLATLEGHTGEVTDAAFVPGENKLLSASLDGTLISWDTRTWRQLEKTIRLEDGIESCDVSVDGALIALADAKGQVQVHRRADNTTLLCVGSFSDFARRCRFLPDGRLLSVGRSGLMIHNPRTGELLTRFEGGLTVRDCAVAPTGLVALACEGAKVCLYDPDAGEVIRTLYLDRDEGAAWACAFSPDGSLLLGSGGKLWYSNDVAALGQSSIWRTGTWESVEDFEHPVAATACRFLDEDTFLIGLLDGSLHLYDARTRQHHVRGAHAKTIQTLSMADGILVTASLDGRLRAWKTDNLVEDDDTGRAGRGLYCAFAGPSARTWIGAERGFEYDFRQRDLDADGAVSDTPLWLDGEVSFGLRMFRRDAATPLTGVVVRWEDARRTPPHPSSPIHGRGTYWLLASSGRMYPFQLSLLPALPASLWSPENVRWARSREGEFALLRRGRLVCGQVEYRFDCDPHQFHLPQVSFSQDASRVLFVSGEDLHVLDLRTGLGDVLLSSGGGLVHAFCESPSGTRIVVACEDGSLREVSADDVRHLTGHEGPVVDCSFLDDDMPLSLGRDGTLRVWADGRVRAVFVGRTPLTAFAVDPSENRILASDSAGAVYLLAPQNLHT
ncbi:DUF4062 domain-containing protein [Arthrobacter sp. RT-1]|uniref:DUF4062 domain-containing protein n=1 Tax=Arthrobacter sp. RT-1 TaxID=2292263 RepID=UPI000E1F59A1|nr:DUF4062 domain-containing protein [Arthrobacter sp. RT-1]RDV10468.1 DUF4062 domain-containing protein [Arthrobacter sp. RT-1]